MNSSKQTVALSVSGFVCLGLSLYSLFRAVDYAATAGDAMFEPESVCNAACKQHWVQYGNHSGRWAAAFLFLFTAS